MKRLGMQASVLGMAFVGLLFARRGSADMPDARNQCASNGASCTFVSSGYGNGTPGICVSGACTFCKGAACSRACMGLRGREQAACAQRVVQAVEASLERERVVAQEKAEWVALLQKLQREAVETDDCSPGVPLGTNNCGQHWVRDLSDTDLDGAVALVQGQVDRVAAIDTDVGAPVTSNANIVTHTAELAAKEKACRASALCMAARRAKALVQDICAAIAEIQSMQERMRIEHANPSGVVDLVELHDDGEIIQRDQAILARDKSEYLKVGKKPFVVTTCCETSQGGDPVQWCGAKPASTQ